MDIEKRILKLEKENKTLKTVLYCLAGLITGAGIIALINDRKYSDLKKKGKEALKRFGKNEDVQHLQDVGHL